MKSNMSTVDRIVRILIAIVVLVLYLTHQISGVLAIVLIIVAAVFLLTSLINFCPLYRVLGISTKKKEINQ